MCVLTIVVISLCNSCVTVEFSMVSRVVKIYTNYAKNIETEVASHLLCIHKSRIFFGTKFRNIWHITLLSTNNCRKVIMAPKTVRFWPTLWFLQARHWSVLPLLLQLILLQLILLQQQQILLRYHRWGQSIPCPMMKWNLSRYNTGLYCC